MKIHIGILLISLIFSSDSYKGFFKKNVKKDSSLNLAKINKKQRNLEGDVTLTTIITTETITTIPFTDIVTTQPITTIPFTDIVTTQTITTIPFTDIVTTQPITTIPFTTVQEEQNVTKLVQDKLLLGFDHYTYASNILSFFTYVRYLLKNNESSFDLPLILTRNLRNLEDNRENATCSLISNNNNIYKYNCSIVNMTGTITKVEVDIKNSGFNSSKLANITGKSLQDQKGDKISDKGFVIIYNCQIQKDGDNIIINGKNDSSFVGSNSVLYVANNDNNIVEIPATLTYKNNDEVELKLTPKRSITSNLSETLGKINDDKNIYLIFDNTNLTDLEYTAPSHQVYQGKKSSGGLSAGGIVAIILPCIAVLLAITAVAYLFGRKQTVVPPTQNIGNNTIGINSSTNVVH